MTLARAMDRFLITSRELFNTQFRLPTPWEDPHAAWDRRDLYTPVRNSLFHAMVTTPEGLQAIDYGRPHPQIGVKLSNPGEAGINLNRIGGEQHGNWDHPVDRVGSSAGLRFVSFFDWAEIERADYRYVLVEVTAWPDAPQLVGHFGLVETFSVTYERLG